MPLKAKYTNEILLLPDKKERITDFSVPRKNPEARRSYQKPRHMERLLHAERIRAQMRTSMIQQEPHWEHLVPLQVVKQTNFPLVIQHLSEEEQFL